MVNRISIVTDLGYGDSGKGAFVDYLCAKEGATLVIRDNGGANAGHNVVTPDGTHHCFSQFGSGTLAGAKTYLGSNMLVSPMYLWDEAKKLAALGVDNPQNKIIISRQCRVITPYHELLNRVRETMRGDQRHGSCGYGIGELMSDTLSTEVPILTIDDIALASSINPIQIAFLKNKLYLIWEQKARLIKELSGQILENFDDEILEFYKLFNKTFEFDWYDSFDLHSLFEEHEHVVFEGSQGVMIDETFGFHPYTTWSDTTPRPAHELIDEFVSDSDKLTADIHTYGLFRAYSTRHGAGPFPSYSAEMTAQLADPHNPTNPWQGDFKCGPFDMVAAMYALNVCNYVGYPIDSLVFSCLDQLDENKQVVISYSDNQIGSTLYTHGGTHGYTNPGDWKTNFSLEDREALTTNAFDFVSGDLNTLTFQSFSAIDFVWAIANPLQVPISYVAYGATRDDRSPAIIK